MTRLKKYLTENKVDIITAALASAGAIAGYTLACRLGGFRMVRPMASDDTGFYVQSISGAILKSPTIK